MSMPTLHSAHLLENLQDVIFRQRNLRKRFVTFFHVLSRGKHDTTRRVDSHACSATRDALWGLLLLFQLLIYYNLQSEHVGWNKQNTGTHRQNDFPYPPIRRHITKALIYPPSWIKKWKEYESQLLQRVECCCIVHYTASLITPTAFYLQTKFLLCPRWVFFFWYFIIYLDLYYHSTTSTTMLM